MIGDVEVGEVAQLAEHSAHGTGNLGVFVGFFPMPGHPLSAGQAKPALRMPTTFSPPPAKVKNHPQQFKSILLHSAVCITSEHGFDFGAKLGGYLFIGVQIQNPRLGAVREGVSFLIHESRPIAMKYFCVMLSANFQRGVGRTRVHHHDLVAPIEACEAALHDGGLVHAN